MLILYENSRSQSEIVFLVQKIIFILILSTFVKVSSHCTYTWCEYDLEMPIAPALAYIHTDFITETSF